jgi:hypothetical protein
MNSKKNIEKTFITLGLALAFLTIMPVARADEWNQASRLTFNQSVQIPGRVLPAGTYWFVLANTASNRNVVQIFSADRSTLYGTILTVSASRLEPTDHTAITFAKQGSMPANAIVTWFYPGFSSGQEFVYSKSENQELARAKHQTVMASRGHQVPAAPDQIVVIGD